MKKYLLDTNTLISFVTDRNIEQQKKISPFFDKASQGSVSLYVHMNVLTEFVYVLQKVYRIKKNQIYEILELLINSKGIYLISEVDFLNVASLWKKNISDFGDAIIASYAQVSKEMEILTFDKKLQNELLALKIPCIKI